MGVVRDLLTRSRRPVKNSLGARSDLFASDFVLESSTESKRARSASEVFVTGLLVQGTHSMHAAILDHVTKTFAQHVAVDDLSLEIPQGSVYGFIGPNGAGKTTSIRMIMNILLPDEGRVEVLGKPAGGGVMDRIGYLPEERGMYRKMKVQDLISFYGQLKGMRSSEIRPRITNWLDRMGLTEWRTKKVEELSKGMQQKIQFIATVIHDPELVILDEPFSGLDPVNTETLTEIVLSLREEKKTVIFSTHVMEQAEKLCDNVFMICKGKKMLDGSIEEIRQQFSEDTFDLYGEGNVQALESLAGVRGIRDLGGRVEVFLERGADSQAVLQSILPHYRIRRCELRAPDLHDIFIRVAGEEGAEGLETAA